MHQEQLMMDVLKLLPPAWYMTRSWQPRGGPS